MPLLKKVSRKLRDVHARLHVAGRKSFARAVYSVPALKHHDPRRRVVTFRQHCPSVARFPEECPGGPSDWYLPVQPSQTIHREHSIAVDANQARQFLAATARYQSGHTIVPQVFLAAVRRPRLLRDSMILLSRDDHIFFESAFSKHEVLEQHGVLDRVVRPRPAVLRGEHCLLGTPWSGGYYHWLLEALPRLATFERFPALAAAPLLVSGKLSPFQRETLALLGISEERVRELPAAVTEVERLFFPQIPAPTGNPSPQAVAWLRSRLLPPAGVTTPRPRRKLYISRRDAPQRRLINEEEIVRLVQRAGFEIVTLGTMSVADQIALFRETSAVIAPHGAGVTNTLFCPDGATIVELFGTNYVNGCFWALANLCGHRHAFLTGEPTGLDYRVSLAQLEQLLVRVGLG